MLIEKIILKRWYVFIDSIIEYTILFYTIIRNLKICSFVIKNIFEPQVLFFKNFFHLHYKYAGKINIKINVVLKRTYILYIE